MTLYIRNTENTAWVEFPSGPRIFSYDSSPSASANPWQRVYEIKTGASFNTSLWTLSDPVTYTFDATIVNSLRNEDGTVSTDNMSSVDYDKGTRWVRSGFTVGRGSMLAGRSSSVENGKVNVGVAGVFVDPNAAPGQPSDLKTVITTAMLERPVIKSIVLSTRRRARTGSITFDFNEDIMSGQLWTCLYKGIPTMSDAGAALATAKYALADVRTSGTGTTFATPTNISTSNWEVYADFAVTQDTLLSVMNNNYSIALVNEVSNQSVWSQKSTSSSSDRIEMRGPSTGGAINANRPTLKVTLDYY